MLYKSLNNGDELYQIECTNFAGFRRRRLPELNEKVDLVKIKKWHVRDQIKGDGMYLHDNYVAGRSDHCIKIKKNEFDFVDQDYYHPDEQTAIDAAKKMWDEDLYKLKMLIIKTTSNEEIHCERDKQKEDLHKEPEG